MTSIPITVSVRDALGATATTSVTAQTASNVLDIPMSWNDPMFTNMTEIPWNGADWSVSIWNKSVSHISIDTTVDPKNNSQPIYMGADAAGTAKLSYSRTRGVNGFRGDGGTTILDHCYIWGDTTGNDAAHGDGIFYLIVTHPYPHHITHTNCFVRCTAKAPTSAWFGGQNNAWSSGSTLTIQNCIFYCDHAGYSIRIQGMSPPTGGNLTLYFKDVYCVLGYSSPGDTSSPGDIFMEVNYKGQFHCPIRIMQWENVRRATFDANGNLVPGNLIDWRGTIVDQVNYPAYPYAPPASATLPYQSPNWP